MKGYGIDDQDIWEVVHLDDRGMDMPDFGCQQSGADLLL